VRLKRGKKGRTELGGGGGGERGGKGENAHRHANKPTDELTAFKRTRERSLFGNTIFQIQQLILSETEFS
jgi:hypothetical protein